MTDPPPRPHPRRGIGFGEIIGLAAVVISGIGVWIAWQSANDGPTRVVEQRQPIPLALRATAERGGKALAIAPVETGHALQSLRITIPGVRAVTIGSDGQLDARDLDEPLKIADGERKGSHSRPVTIDARYVEAGAERRRTVTYQLRYHWVGGGLFGGRSLRLDGLSRG